MSLAISAEANIFGIARGPRAHNKNPKGPRLIKIWQPNRPPNRALHRSHRRGFVEFPNFQKSGEPPGTEPAKVLGFLEYPKGFGNSRIPRITVHVSRHF